MKRIVPVAGLALSFGVAMLFCFKLIELLERLVAEPEWSQHALWFHYVALPVGSILFSSLGMDASRRLAPWARWFSLLVTAVFIAVCASFFTLVFVGRVYAD